MQFDHNSWVALRFDHTPQLLAMVKLPVLGQFVIHVLEWGRCGADEQLFLPYQSCCFQQPLNHHQSSNILCEVPELQASLTIVLLATYHSTVIFGRCVVISHSMFILHRYWTLPKQADCLRWPELPHLRIHTCCYYGCWSCCGHCHPPPWTCPQASVLAS